MSTHAATALERARQALADRSIETSDAVCAFRSLHPHVASHLAETGMLLEVASFLNVDPPYTVDSIAEQMANRAGAFPWDGPVGNGMTLAYYRSEFRRFARDQLFLMQQLGLAGGDTA